MQEQLTAVEENSKKMISDQIQFHQEKYTAYKKQCTKEMDEKFEELLIQNQELAETIHDLKVDSISSSTDEDQSIKF